MFPDKNKLPFIAQSEDERSEAVVLAFSGIWLKNLLDRRPSHIFRKTSPSTITPLVLVIYGGSPHKSFIGTARVESVTRQSVSKCLGLSRMENTLPEELELYAKGSDELSVYTVTDYQLFGIPIPAAEIQSKFSFHPPQNFLLPSRSALSWIQAEGMARTRSQR